MLRKLTIFFLVFTIFSGGSITIFAEENEKRSDETGAKTVLINSEATKEEDISKYITVEKPMPNVNSTKGANEKKVMTKWIDDTTEYLELYHQQEVEKVVEDAEKVAFYFDCDYIDYYNEKVESVVYYKATSSKASTGDTKITTYSAWSNGAVPITQGSKTATNIATAAGILITLHPGVSIVLKAVVQGVFGYVGRKVDASLPVKADTKAAIKYKRKIGSYYLSTGFWWPSVQIGRAEYWYYHTAYQPAYKNGPYVPSHKDNIPNSAENDYDVAKNKSHYTDTTWILNKVKALSNSGNTYIDIFG